MVNGNANNDFSNQKDVALQVSGPNNAFGNLIKSSFKTKSKSQSPLNSIQVKQKEFDDNDIYTQGQRWKNLPQNVQKSLQNLSLVIGNDGQINGQQRA